MYEIYEKLLKIKGIKSSDVSKTTGISNMTFSDWKNGKSTPKPDKLALIADYFEVTIDFLMGRTEQIECHGCGQKYNPLDEFDSAIHETYHSKILQAQRLFPFLTPYAEATEIRAHSLIKLNNSDIDKETKLDMIGNYVKAAFSIYVYTNFEPNKVFDYDDFCKTELVKLIESGDIPKELIDEVANIYGIDTEYINQTDLLLARASKNDQLMRLLAYAEKLTPQMLDAIEVQLKALVNQQEDTKTTHRKTDSTIQKFTTVSQARDYLGTLHSFAAFNPNEISDEALIKIANTVYESQNN